MKRIFILSFLLIMTVLSACSSGEDIKVADKFHDLLDKKDYDAIIDEMVYEEELEMLSREEWLTFFADVESWGPQTNRTKAFGFSTKIQNGVTTSKLNYEFDTDKGHFYERLVLVDRGQGYKLLLVAMNTDESVVEAAAAGY